MLLSLKLMEEWTIYALPSRFLFSKLFLLIKFHSGLYLYLSGVDTIVHAHQEYLLFLISKLLSSNLLFVNYSCHVLSCPARTAGKIEAGGVTPFPAVVQCHLSAGVGQRLVTGQKELCYRKWNRKSGEKSSLSK